MKTYSEQFHYYYEIEDVIHCKDPKQQRLYLKHGRNWRMSSTPAMMIK